MKYHINPDGIVPCCNCGKGIDLFSVSFHGDNIWLHMNGTKRCFGVGTKEQACPLTPNDDIDHYNDKTNGSVGDTESAGK